MKKVFVFLIASATMLIIPSCLMTLTSFGVNEEIKSYIAITSHEANHETALLESVIKLPIVSVSTTSVIAENAAMMSNTLPIIVMGDHRMPGIVTSSVVISAKRGITVLKVEANMPGIVASLNRNENCAHESGNVYRI